MSFEKGGMFYPVGPDSEAQVIEECALELYEEASRLSRDAWLVIAVCGNQIFTYPITTSFGVSKNAVIREAHRQHSADGHPNPSESIQVLHITSVIYDEIKNRKNRPMVPLVPSPGVCDFCGARPIRTVYPCADYMQVTGIMSYGGWAACDDCSLMVEKEDRAGLVERSLASAPEFRNRVEGARSHMIRSVDDFFQHRQK